VSEIELPEDGKKKIAKYAVGAVIALAGLAGAWTGMIDDQTAGMVAGAGLAVFGLAAYGPKAVELVKEHRARKKAEEAADEADKSRRAAGK